MASWKRVLVSVLIAGAIAGAGIQLIRHGLYGLTIFLVMPFALGALAAWSTGADSVWAAVRAGALVNWIASWSLLLIGMEGFICVAMSWPIVILQGALGAWLFYAVKQHLARPQMTAMALLPVGLLSLGWDTHAPPDVFEVRTSMEIAAPPERVWDHVVSFPDITAPREWFFRTGIAYPKDTRIEGSGAGAIRYCDLSTGPVVETVEVWDAPRLLQFRVTRTPPPMREWSPYGEISAPHLHGYFLSKRGRFRLIPLANGHTLVEGTSWYQHGLWPAQYWRAWSDAIVHRIHRRVLLQIKALSEGTP